MSWPSVSVRMHFAAGMFTCVSSMSGNRLLQAVRPSLVHNDDYFFLERSDKDANCIPIRIQTLIVLCNDDITYGL